MPIIEEGITAPQLGVSIGKWIKDQTISVAEAALRDEVGRGFDNEPVVITDGVPRRDYLSVKAFGTIEFVARPQMAEAVLWALKELQRISPVGPGINGHYRDKHKVMLNGQEIMGNVALELRGVKPDDRVQIVNPQPYARKLEGATANRKTGRGKRRASSRQAPNGIYRVVLASLAQRYGKSIFFDFKYVRLNTGLKVWGRQGGRVGKTGRALQKRVQRDQVYPALQFFIKQASGPVESVNVR